MPTALYQVPVYVEKNDHFRLPADGDTPIIMIGAGTGVAPYRAFIEHRAALGHRGDNWLIFGDRNFASDFLYQLEWLRYRKDGLLTRLDVAFSRDQQQKQYVQHRVLEQARELRNGLSAVRTSMFAATPTTWLSTSTTRCKRCWSRVANARRNKPRLNWPR
ncbi:MAG: hypothetical protein U5K38_02320 [Woeseiaceae bacterium]|nr:hypothetical protein [Woeseiaceae bacterium]